MRRLLVPLTALLILAATTAPAHAAAAGREGAPAAAGTLDYSQLITAIDRHQVEHAVIDQRAGRVRVTLDSGDEANVAIPANDAGLAESLARSGATVEFRTSGGTSPFVFIAMAAIAIALAVTVANLFARRRNTGGGRRERRGAAEEPQVETRFGDVAGCDEAVEELRDMLDFLQNPERFATLGAKMPSGILLHGPPGTGKTLLARALAGEAGIPFHAASGSDFVEMYVGVGAKRIRELFARARSSERGAVVFIDEIDAVGRRRGASPGNGQEAENTLNALLVELDGFHGRPGLICVAATNRADVLDEALLRPGRLGMQVQVDLPDEAGRRAILGIHGAGKPFADDVDLDDLARYTAGSSGAQLSDMINQAAIVAARAERDEISDGDLREGHLRVLAGPERRSSPFADGERRIVAWHEAGHVLAAELLETQDKAQRVTIRPRGRAAGLAVYGQTDRALHSPRYVHERMVCILAGRAAEQVLVGEISSGAANDLQQANLLARKAVTELGFSERVGQLLSELSGRDLALSDSTRRVIDEEVERLVADAYTDALRLMQEERRRLDRLASTLLERGQLERVDVLVALGGTLPQRGAPRVAERRRRLTLVAPLQEQPPTPREGMAVAFARWVESRPWARRRAAS